MEDTIHYADILEQAFKTSDLKFIREDDDEDAVFSFLMPAEKFPGLFIQLIVDDQGDSKYRCFIARNIPDKKKFEIAMTCNLLNYSFRYITFSVNKDGDVLAGYDFIFQGRKDNEIVSQAVSTLYLCVSITNHCAPLILSRIWKEELDTDNQGEAN